MAKKSANKLKLEAIEREITIEGIPFMVEAGDVEATAAAHALFEAYKDVDISSVGTGEYIDMANRIMATIDGILGEGAVKRIAEARREANPHRKASLSIIHLISILNFAIKAVADSDAIAAVESAVADLVETADGE